MPPTTPATSTGERRTSRRCRCVACIATPLAEIAPTTNWPSAPMFQTLERKQTARPSAISSSGVAFTASSDERIDALHRLDEEDRQAAQRILAEQHEQARADHHRDREREQRRGDRHRPRRLGARLKLSAWLASVLSPRHRPLIHSPICSIVASRVGTLGETRPWAMTTRRSQISNSSSSSSLTTSTAQPSSRSASSSPRICAAAPTSTPQVGCETISSFGSASISRPTMNFCRLPPDRLFAAEPGPPALTLKRRISALGERVARRRRGASRRGRRRACASAACSAPARASAPRRGRAAPRARSAGPRGGAGAARRARCRRRRGGSNPRGARRSSPESAAISSCWPLPETPAMPTTSPARTSKRDRLERGAERVFLGQREALHREHHRAGSRLAVLQLRRLGADHQARQAGVGLLRRVDLARDLAAAQHRAVVAERADLVELVRDVEDRAALGASLRSVTNSVCTACGVSTEVGSSRISSFGLGHQRAHDLDALPLADRQRVHRPQRVDVEAVLAGDLADALRHLGERERLVEAEPDVLGRGQRVEQAEVLVDHADAERPRLVPASAICTGSPFQRISPSSGGTAP